jgi:hypothetical protein
MTKFYPHVNFFPLNSPLHDINDKDDNNDDNDDDNDNDDDDNDNDISFD